MSEMNPGPSGEKIISRTRSAGLALLAAFLVLLFIPENFRRSVLAIFDALLILVVAWVLVAAVVLLQYGVRKAKSLVALAGLFLMCPTVLWLLGSRWDLFVRVPGIISIDSRPASHARLYRGFNSELLVITDNSDMPSVYVPRLADVLDCDRTLFHDYRLFGRLEKGKDEYLCMSSAKEEITRNLQADKKFLSFDRAYRNTVQRITIRQ